MNKIALISANMRGLDKVPEHVPQSIGYDNFMFTDDNFPPRFTAMTPRLQAKIPKFFAWQMVPNYEYYMWIDGNFSLSHTDSIKYFYDHCQGYDIVVLKHPSRPDIRQEARYIRKGLKQKARYIVSRYENELLKEQMEEIVADKDFVDDMLVTGGVFMYKNTPKVRQMLKEWWYHVSRYIIEDQISFPYVLKKSGIKINIRPDVFNDCVYLSHKGHKAGSK